MASVSRTPRRVSGEVGFVLLVLRKALQAEWNSVEAGKRVVVEQYREQVEAKKIYGG